MVAKPAYLEPVRTRATKPMVYSNKILTIIRQASYDTFVTSGVLGDSAGDAPRGNEKWVTIFIVTH